MTLTLLLCACFCFLFRCLYTPHPQLPCPSPPLTSLIFLSVERCIPLALPIMTRYVSLRLPTPTPPPQLSSKGEPLANDSLPTVGGAILTIRGRNFGEDPLQVRVLWNGVPVPGVLISEPHTTLTLSTPPGQGPFVNVTVVVGGQSTTQGPDGDAPALVAAYGPPNVATLRVRREPGVPTMDCNVVSETSGKPQSGTVLSTVLILSGVNFGLGDATSVTIRGIPCAVLNVSHFEVVVETELCSGACAVLSVSRPPPPPPFPRHA